MRSLSPCRKFSNHFLRSQGFDDRPELPSRPGEFHPEPLTDPDMSLSIHPARAIVRRLPPSAEIAGSSRFDPVGPRSTTMTHPLRSMGITPYAVHRIRGIQRSKLFSGVRGRRAGKCPSSPSCTPHNNTCVAACWRLCRSASGRRKADGGDDGGRWGLRFFVESLF
jgi:hypothetical protein